MESIIKVKARPEQMDFFERHFCVKYWERVKFLHDSKGRWLYNVRLRHGEEHGELKGTYTVEFVMNKLRGEAVHENLERVLDRAIDTCINDLSFFGEMDKMKDVLNEALQKKLPHLKVA